MYFFLFKILVPRITFGNHFCDGDSSHMRIQNGQPKFLQVNVHTFGALYGYNNETGIFDFISGETIEVTDGLDFEVRYHSRFFVQVRHKTMYAAIKKIIVFSLKHVTIRLEELHLREERNN